MADRVLEVGMEVRMGGVGRADEDESERARLNSVCAILGGGRGRHSGVVGYMIPFEVVINREGLKRRRHLIAKSAHYKVE